MWIVTLVVNSLTVFLMSSYFSFWKSSLLWVSPVLMKWLRPDCVQVQLCRQSSVVPPVLCHTQPSPWYWALACPPASRGHTSQLFLLCLTESIQHVQWRDYITVWHTADQGWHHSNLSNWESIKLPPHTLQSVLRLSWGHGVETELGLSFSWSITELHVH